MSDEEKLGALRGLWRDAMADSRVPRGTSDFIRQHEGKVSVVDGVLRFDFPAREAAESFSGRSASLATVFGEMLNKPLAVDVGVIGQTQSGREPSDDSEGDSRPDVAAPAPPKGYAQPAAQRQPPRPAADSGAMTPAQAAVARASARSAELNSAPSPDMPARWADEVPPDEHDDPALHAGDDPYMAEAPSAESRPRGGAPAGLPSDLPDIVMDDFPAPPPAAMPAFLAPPPRQAPVAPTPARDEGGSRSRLAQYRSAPEAAPERIDDRDDVENEHERVSTDDPLALDAHTVGLDVVLDVLGARVVEEVTEEA